MGDETTVHPAEPAETVTGPLDQYRRLIESLTDYAIFSLSIDGRIASWNSGAKYTFGYAEDEVLGKDYSLIFSAEDVAAGRPAAELQESLEFGKSSVDGWHVRKDGTRFWCTDTVQAIRDTAGVATGFTKIVRDSTERHDAEAILHESEERLRLLIEGVTDYAIFSIDPAGSIMSWNSGAEHVFGYCESDVLGKHFSLIYSPEAIARGAPEQELAAAERSGYAVDEDWHVRKDGERFFASGRMTRLRPGVDGEPRGFVKIAHDITARNNAVESITRQAFHDDLTQLPNRAYFSDCLRRSIAHAKRNPALRFAVIFLDLDRFKVINDSVGHTLADGLLIQVARLLEHCVRPDDIVARLGGDEFTILLSEIHAASDATQVAARIHAALQEPIRLEQLEVFTSASMGIAIGSAAYDLPEQIVRDADTAMYEAKAAGRSRHVLFDAAMHARAVGILDLQMDLRRAIARHEFFVEYQPIVALGKRRVLGFEALARWNHPKRGAVSPVDFIGEAESIGLVTQIDRWVMDEACRQLRIWQGRSGDQTLSMSVNVSTKHFGSGTFVSEIKEVLERHALAPHCLKLEITETALMDRFDSTSAMIAKIRELGVDLSIDDFGTGYSSLSYLTRFPLQMLKVDRSFVSQTSSDARSIEVVRALVGLARNLGLQTLAEGIETEEQFLRLRELGCKFGQGFWFSRPVSADVAETLIGQVLPRPALRPVPRHGREHKALA